ncbi:MAG: hypothetical protein OES13_00225 [Acidimicrobiia bacterium]|nr:hypothetical protein [Acidimicrobiia bacterium]
MAARDEDLRAVYQRLVKEFGGSTPRTKTEQRRIAFEEILRNTLNEQRAKKIDELKYPGKKAKLVDGPLAGRVVRVVAHALDLRIVVGPDGGLLDSACCKDWIYAGAVSDYVLTEDVVDGHPAYAFQPRGGGGRAYPK